MSATDPLYTVRNIILPIIFITTTVLSKLYLSHADSVLGGLCIPQSAKRHCCPNPTPHSPSEHVVRCALPLQFRKASLPLLSPSSTSHHIHLHMAASQRKGERVSKSEVMRSKENRAISSTSKPTTTRTKSRTKPTSPAAAAAVFGINPFTPTEPKAHSLVSLVAFIRRMHCSELTEEQTID